MNLFFLKIILFIGLIESLGCSHFKNQNPPIQASASSEQTQTQPQIQSNQSPAPFFNWPVDKAKLVRGFLPQKKRPHLGLDLAASKGTPIFSAHSGIVIYSGRDFKGFGKMILVEGEQGWATLYAHLSKIEVKMGDKVSQGQEIGKMGRTGRASGVHLHFEIRQAHYGPVDPLLYLPGAQTVSSN